MVMKCNCPHCGGTVYLDAAVRVQITRDPNTRWRSPEDVVVEGIRRLGAMQIATSARPSARNHPVKLLMERGWNVGHDPRSLTDAVGALIGRGVLVDGTPFDGRGGRPRSLKANHQPRLGIWFAAPIPNG